MGKSYSVEQAQQCAFDLRKEMLGKRYRHWKGGIYRVMWIDVDEATGQPRISYQSEKLGYVWNRTLADFEQYLPDERCRRFTKMTIGES